MGGVTVTRSVAEVRQERRALEQEMPVEDRFPEKTPYSLLKRTASLHGDKPASSFQLLSDPGSKSQTLTWKEMFEQVTQAANLFRSLGVQDDDAVAYLLPGLNEAVVTVMGAMTAGRANPINPLLDHEAVAGILRESQAKVLVTLRSFPKSDIAEKAAMAAALAPSVETIVEIDMMPHLGGVKRVIAPLLRPKLKTERKARVIDFHKALKAQPKDRLTFEEAGGNRVCALFHTGGTTGQPKLAQHRQSGAIYNAWSNAHFIFTADDVVLCPLPLFHVMAVYPIWMACVMTGAHMIQTTPAGYRGDGVFDNFWKLVENWKISVIVTVPTAAAEKLKHPVNADVSSLRIAVAGSAPFPRQLFKQFEDTVGVRILEGYGMTEATCIISANPFDGERKVGSVGIPAPYTDVKMLEIGPDGRAIAESEPDIIGEICVNGPGITPNNTYTEQNRNDGMFVEHDGKVYLRSGDLGYKDEDGYIFITGRAKDLIIRGGHNIDPGLIEETLIGHKDVSFVGAIGQPDAHSGELPAAYVELVDGATATVQELMDYAKKHVHERAAVPKHIEILDELPKTAVGKVFKPDLRKRAIGRVLSQEFEKAGLSTRVSKVRDDKHYGLVAMLDDANGIKDPKVEEVMGNYAIQWEWNAEA